jgi:hypothetical protein
LRQCGGEAAKQTLSAARWIDDRVARFDGSCAGVADGQAGVSHQCAVVSDRNDGAQRSGSDALRQPRDIVEIVVRIGLAVATAKTRG